MNKYPSDNSNHNDGVPVPNADHNNEIDRFIAALESDEGSIDSLTANDQAVFQFGAAIRKSTHDDLPPISEKLREHLVAKLDHDSLSLAPAAEKMASKITRRTYSPIALAACLLLALGLIAIMFAMPAVQRVREAGRREGIEPRGGIELIDGLELSDNQTWVADDVLISKVAPSGISEIPVDQAGSQTLSHPGDARSRDLSDGAKPATTRFSSSEGKNPRPKPFGTFGGLGGIGGRGGGGGGLGGGGRGERGFGSVNGEELSRGGSFFGDGRIVSGVEIPLDVGGSDGQSGQQDDGYHFQFSRRREIVGDFAIEGYYENSGEQYDPITENKFIAVEGQSALSTFSIDVDTASYANMRRFLLNGQRPPRNAIRIEELVNYFIYDYPQPTGDHPFAVDMELANCPWNEQHQLLRVALKGKEVHRDERSPSNLVFLLDVSGSMQSDDKLPLLKQGLTMMVQQLSENDSVSIVTYAGNAGVVLNPTAGSNKLQIERAIDQLNAGGSTNGSAGIEVAYQLAQQQLLKQGSNRVILATDGDLNVGVTDDSALVKLIKDKASEGVFLTVLGFGTGNLKDSKLEKLADNGNGIYAYIDSVREAHKVLIEQISGSLETIAKDVKLQIEFNPAEVAGYRLIGYENRLLATEDFDNDRKDAGEIGAGHSVTALYEIVLKNAAQPEATTSQPLKYQTSASPESTTKVHPEPGHRGELLTVALRYKQPDSNTSQRIEFALANEPKSFSSASGEFRFAASVASFGMILRGSQYRGNTSLRWVEETASRALGDDVGGYRSEFLDLVRRASSLR